MSSTESQVGTGRLSPTASFVYVTLEFAVGLDGHGVMIHGTQDEHPGEFGFIDEALAHGLYDVWSWLPPDWRTAIRAQPCFITLTGFLGWSSDMHRDACDAREFRSCRHLAFVASGLEHRPLSDIIDNHRWAPHIAWLDRMRRALG